jgi:hypothetical protein
MTAKQEKPKAIKNRIVRRVNKKALKDNKEQREKNKYNSKQDAINKITPYIQRGSSLERALSLAGYAHSTIYKWISEDPEFKEKLKQAENFFFISLEKLLYETISEKKDGHLILKVLERRDKKRYNTSIDVNHTGNQQDITIYQIPDNGRNKT